MTASDRPNVLLVVLDTARADSVGLARDSAFQQLARRGRVYGHAIAPAPWTLPSHASMFSGLLPNEHGITGAAVLTDHGPRSPRPLVERLVAAGRWLPATMRAKGYATFAASGNPWIGDATGLALGFDMVYAAWAHAPLPKLSDPLAASTRTGVARKRRAAAVYARRALGVGDGGAALSLDVLGSFLGGLGGRPFFGFVNVMEPHAPYAPPRGFDPLGLRRRPAALRAVRSWNAERMLRFNVGREEITDDELALLRGLYAGECAYTDAWLARLLERLDRARVLDDTVVVVTADHGENLGEHHLLSHVMSMHEALLHVPLVIAGPGVPAGEERRPVGLGALAQTAVAAADGRWSDPAEAPGPAVAEYESAAAQVSGARRLEDQVGDIPDALRAELRARRTAVYDGVHKLVVGTDGEEHLYDLSSDPGEERPLADAGALARVRAMLPAAAEPAEPTKEALDAEITAHLEGLGYL